MPPLNDEVLDDAVDLPQDIPEDQPDPAAVYMPIEDNLNLAHSFHAAMNQEFELADVGGVAPAPQLYKPLKAKSKISSTKPQQQNPYEMAAPDIQAMYFDEGYAAKKADLESQQKGLLIFYINIGNLATGPALDMLDAIKTKYKSMETTLRSNKIEVMWMPRSKGKTEAQFIPFV